MILLKEYFLKISRALNYLKKYIYFLLVSKRKFESKIYDSKDIKNHFRMKTFYFELNKSFWFSQK